MDVKKFLQTFPFGKGIVPFLVGDTGVGKTTLVKSVFPDAAVVLLQQQPATEVAGIPRILDGGDTLQYKLPAWTDAPVILFDEVDKAYEASATILTLITSRELRGKKVTSRIILAGQVNFDDPFWETETGRALNARSIFIDCTSVGVEYVRELYANAGLVPPKMDVLTPSFEGVNLGLITPRKAEWLLKNREFVEQFKLYEFVAAKSPSPKFMEALATIVECCDEGVASQNLKRFSEALTVVLLRWRDGTDEDRRIIRERLEGKSFILDDQLVENLGEQVIALLKELQ
ncbi:MAG: hypothetical protein KatS3mg038_2175 [Candidatus Kapaibacterium sp.]|nr:MAG: hypothetical protein KatS3mg038_2175 [Candidatus Kapabacteria bacterium]